MTMRRSGREQQSATQPFSLAFGTLRLLSGRTTKVVDIAAFAAAHPQSASSLGTIPGETPWDAGANDLLYVSATGRISMLARFPAVAEQLPAGVLGNPAPISVMAQAVPTSVAIGIGADGAVYVSSYGDGTTSSSGQAGEIVKITGLH